MEPLPRASTGSQVKLTYPRLPRLTSIPDIANCLLSEKLTVTCDLEFNLWSRLPLIGSLEAPYGVVH